MHWTVCGQIRKDNADVDNLPLWVAWRTAVNEAVVRTCDLARSDIIALDLPRRAQFEGPGMPDGDRDVTGALEGVRVLDLTTGSFGYAGRMLAGLGADVVKVEPPSGDEVRGWPPFAGDEPGPERALRHLHLNAGKRSVVLDLETAEGRDEFRRMVHASDAVIESQGPGVLASLGLGYEELRVERGDLVMASLSAFGQSGPRAQDQGSEIVDAAIGGYLRLTGDPDREPVKPFDDLVIQHAALHAAAAIVIGLFDRDRSGRGDCFDVSAADAALFMLGGALQNYAVSGELFVRNGARLLRTDPTSPYPSTLRPCRDGWVHAHLNYRHPDLLAVMMADPVIDELLELPTGNADAIDQRMDLWLAEHDRAEVVRHAQELRVPFTEVFSPAEVLEDAHLAERCFFVDLDYPELGTVTQPGAPVRLSATPWQTARAPALGEHTDEVLDEWTASPPEVSASLSAAGRAANATSAGSALRGIRVLELTTAVAGPTAGAALADLGAEVIKIDEPASKGRPMVTLPPRVNDDGPSPEDSAYQPSYHVDDLQRGKRHLPLDLTSPAGRDVFLELVKQSDVVLENFSVRVLESWGLTYEQLRAANASIILVSIPAFGSDGPYAERRSYGPGLDAMSGISHLTGYPDRGPNKPASFYGDQTAAMTAVLCTVAALRHRKRSGEGQAINLAMLEGQLQVVAPALLDASVNGRDWSRLGNRHPWHAPQGVYRCRGADRWLAVTVRHADDWRALARTIGHAEWADDASYATAAQRRQRHDELDAAIEQWTSTRDAGEAERLLQTAGVPAGAANDVSEILADPHFRERGSFAEHTHAITGQPFPHSSMAWRSLAGNDTTGADAPRYADGVDHALRDLLGLTSEEVETLVTAGVTDRPEAMRGS